MQTSEASNVFALKNFDLLQMKPSVSVHFSNKLSFNEAVAQRLKDWYIHEIFIGTDIIDDPDGQTSCKTFLNKPFETCFKFTPDVKSYLADHPDSADLILRPRIFSGQQYFSRQISWGNALFRFFGHEPEVIALNKTNKKLALDRGNDIYRIYHCPQTEDIQNLVLKDISDRFNKVKSILTPLPREGWLVILRHYVLLANDRLDERFNYFENAHLKRLLKIFTTHFSKRVGKLNKLYFDFDVFLQASHQRQEADFHPKLLKLDAGLLEKIVRFWLSDTPEFTDYRLIFTKFFEEELKPVLDQTAPIVQYIISASNPMLLTVCPDQSFLIRVDEEKFEQNTPYYLQLLIQLKRAESFRYSQGVDEVPLIFHELLNTTASFEEKNIHLNQLWAYGANHFHFQCDQSLPVLSQLSATDPAEPAYLKFFSRIHQTGHFLKQGTPRTNLLVLYPAMDDNFELFYATMRQLHQTGIAYTLLDIDLFKSDNLCQISANEIIFGKQRFKMILLPAISKMPFDALKKLNHFVDSGGLILSVGRTPQECSNPEQDSEFLKLNHQLWFMGNHSRSTSFKENASGGKTYFQQDISMLDNLISNFLPQMDTHLSTSHSSIHYRFREDQNQYYLFITNSDPQQTVPFELSTRYIGRPYLWDFVSGSSKPFPYWFIEDQQLHIKTQLAGGGQLFLLLNKKEGEEIWQIRQTEAKEIQLIEQSADGLKFSGIIRRPGHYYNILQRGSESKEIPLQVNTRLPILSISPKNWFLESRKLNGGTELGNYARYYPYGSGSFTYHKVIVLEAYYLSGQQLTLHLGALKDWCRLKINDVFVAEKYAPPWTFDISDFVKEGENKISITVLNNVSNRLAKDVEKFPVRDYGLFGPVKIIPATRIQIEL